MKAMDMVDSEYDLGDNVTASAKGTRKSESVVISVRLSADDVRKLELAAAVEGKTYSQVVREALRAHLRRKKTADGPVVTISAGSAGGFISTTGIAPVTSRAGRSAVWKVKDGKNE